MDYTPPIPLVAQPPATVTRALSLTEPWATLLAGGAKRIETRSWATSYRGWVAIQASKGFPRECVELCSETPYRQRLAEHGVWQKSDFKLGHIIGVGYLVGCISTDRWQPPMLSDEAAFGNYDIGRFGWFFASVHKITPFPAKGALGLWTLPRPILPDEFLP